MCCFISPNDFWTANAVLDAPALLVTSTLLPPPEFVASVLAMNWLKGTNPAVSDWALIRPADMDTTRVTVEATHYFIVVTTSSVSLGCALELGRSTQSSHAIKSFNY